MPLTAGQKQEVDDAFGIFDYAKTGVLDLHEVKVRVAEWVHLYAALRDNQCTFCFV